MLHVQCSSCTNRISVTPSQCGGRVNCLCGKTVPVPKLSELRRLNGVGYQNLSPLQRLQKLEDQGELLTDFTCAVCHVRNGDSHECWVQCENKVVNAPGLPSMIAYLFLLPFMTMAGAFAMMLSREAAYEDPEIHGRDTVAIIPVPVCTECESGFRNSNRKRLAALRTIGHYRELLDAYPDATTQYFYFEDE